MNCERAMHTYLAGLGGDATATADAEVRAHLAACAACRQESRTLAATWDDLGRIPMAEPSPALGMRFDAMLAAYRAGARQSKRSWEARAGDWLALWWPRRPAFQLAAAAFLVVLGFGLGWRLDGRGRGTEMAALRDEVQATRALVALSLLEQRSPADRLQGVEWSSRVEHPDPEVLAALLETLDRDPNVNVRLAAVDALAHSREVPSVRRGLLASLRLQSSPLVQVAVIDALVQARERQAVGPLRQLSDDRLLDPAVRDRARWGAEQLNF